MRRVDAALPRALSSAQLSHSAQLTPPPPQQQQPASLHFARTLHHRFTCIMSQPLTLAAIRELMEQRRAVAEEKRRAEEGEEAEAEAEVAAAPAAPPVDDPLQLHPPDDPLPPDSRPLFFAQTGAPAEEEAGEEVASPDSERSYPPSAARLQQPPPPPPTRVQPPPRAAAAAAALTASPAISGSPLVSATPAVMAQRGRWSSMSAASGASSGLSLSPAGSPARRVAAFNSAAEELTQPPELHDQAAAASDDEHSITDSAFWERQRLTAVQREQVGLAAEPLQQLQHPVDELMEADGTDGTSAVPAALASGFAADAAGDDSSMQSELSDGELEEAAAAEPSSFGFGYEADVAAEAEREGHAEPFVSTRELREAAPSPSSIMIGPDSATASAAPSPSNFSLASFAQQHPRGGSSEGSNQSAAAAAAAAPSPAPSMALSLMRQRQRELDESLSTPEQQGQEDGIPARNIWMAVFKPQRLARIGVAYFGLDDETLYGGEYGAIEAVQTRQ